jgi:hypothetical protein
MTSRNNSPNDARSLNDMLEKEAYEKGSKHDVNTAAFHRQWTPKNAAHSGSKNSSYKTGRTHPTLRTYHLAKPTRKPTTLDHTKIAAAFTTFFAAMHIEPRAKAKAIKTLGKGNRVLPPTAAKCDADITPKTKSSIPPRTSQPARAQ